MNAVVVIILIVLYKAGWGLHAIRHAAGHRQTNRGRGDAHEILARGEIGEAVEPPACRGHVCTHLNVITIADIIIRRAEKLHRNAVDAGFSCILHAIVVRVVPHQVAQGKARQNGDGIILHLALQQGCTAERRNGGALHQPDSKVFRACHGARGRCEAEIDSSGGGDGLGGERLIRVRHVVVTIPVHEDIDA